MPFSHSLKSYTALIIRPSPLTLDSTRHLFRLLILCIQRLHIRTVLHNACKWARIYPISDKVQHALKNTRTVLQLRNPRKPKWGIANKLSRLYHVTLPPPFCLVPSASQPWSNHTHTVTPPLAGLKVTTLIKVIAWETCSYHLHRYANSSEYPDHHSVLSRKLEALIRQGKLT